MLVNFFHVFLHQFTRQDRQSLYFISLDSFQMGLHYYVPDVDWGDVGKYALIGACAQLAGTVRLTYSLTAIVIEAIGNLTYLFPVLMTVVVSKHFADLYNRGIYDIHIDLL